MENRVGLIVAENKSFLLLLLETLELFAVSDGIMD